MSNANKVLFIKKLECLDGVSRSFAFNAGAIIYLENYFASLEKTEEDKKKYNLFADFKWDQITNAQTLAVFFYAMGLTDAEDRGELDWSLKTVNRVLDFADVVSLKLLLDSAIIASMPITEEAKKKMTKSQQKLMEQELKKHQKKIKK